MQNTQTLPVLARLLADAGMPPDNTLRRACAVALDSGDEQLISATADYVTKALPRSAVSVAKAKARIIADAADRTPVLFLDVDAEGTSEPLPQGVTPEMFLHGNRIRCRYTLRLEEPATGGLILGARISVPVGAQGPDLRFFEAAGRLGARAADTFVRSHPHAEARDVAVAALLATGGAT